MKQKTNLILLSYIQTHHRFLMAITLKVCKRPEVAEDMLQNVIFKLLKKPIEYDVKNNKQFIDTMIKRMYLNYLVVNKKYYYAGDSNVDNPDFEENIFMDELSQKATPCEYEADLMYTLELQRIRARAKSLPPKQRKSIMDSLNGKEIAESAESKDSRYNTLKATRRHAILKLRA